MSETTNENFKSGYVILLGRPNVGKSTILNGIMGEELAIVTPKPQTTRNRILGIHTTPEHQIIFLDTPGMIKAERGLNAFLAREVQRAITDADGIVLVVEPEEPRRTEQSLIERLRQLQRPVVLAINKIDKIDKRKLLPLIENYLALYPFQAVVPTCATRRDGLDRVVAEAAVMLPLGPMYYPADQLTDVTERFIVGEMIREQVFKLTKQEIPYSSAVLIELFQDKGKLVKILASIFVERDGQKGILIGKNGEMLKTIGTKARAKIEAFLGKQVYLELFVKVKKDWSRSEGKLREMGYE